MLVTRFGKGFDYDLGAGFNDAWRTDVVFIEIDPRSIVDIVGGKLKIRLS